jgi:site-specific DNA recombinase
VLIKALRAAHAMIELTRSGAPIIEAMPGPRYQRRLLRLAFLSPDIQRAILAGRQPAGLRLEDLVRSEIPADWTEQQRWIEHLSR